MKFSRLVTLLVQLVAFEAIVVEFGMVQGHVKMFYRGFPVRNGKGKTGDGGFSEAGPCGGKDKFGDNGVSEIVRDGEEMCLTVNYNGGHARPFNRFQAVFRCGEPKDEQAMIGQTALALTERSSPIRGTGNNNVPAPLGAIINGYTLCFKLPSQGLSASVDADDKKRKCTVSVLDQNNWGGCVDLIVQDPLPVDGNEDDDGVVDLPETPDQFPFPKEYEGTYKFIDCDDESGGPCCLDGYFAINNEGRVAGDIKGVSLAKFSNPDAATDDDPVEEFCSQYAASLDTKLVWEKDAFGTFSSTVTVSHSDAEVDDEPFQIVVRQALSNGVTFFNAGTERESEISDTRADLDRSLDDGVKDGLVPDIRTNIFDETGVTGGLIVAGVMGGFAALAVSMYVYKRMSRRNSDGQHAINPSFDGDSHYSYDMEKQNTLPTAIPSQAGRVMVPPPQPMQAPMQQQQRQAPMGKTSFFSRRFLPNRISAII